MKGLRLFENSFDAFFNFCHIDKHKRIKKLIVREVNKIHQEGYYTDKRPALPFLDKRNSEDIDEQKLCNSKGYIAEKEFYYNSEGFTFELINGVLDKRIKTEKENVHKRTLPVGYDKSGNKAC